VRRENREPAAAAIVEGEVAVSNLAELRGRLAPWFARVEPFGQVEKYVVALMSDLPRKNGWTVAEHLGDATPDRTRRFAHHAVWDHDAAMAAIRGFVAEHLGGAPLVVAALDLRAGEA
jgi:SRSO17 transposase